MAVPAGVLGISRLNDLRTEPIGDTRVLQLLGHGVPVCCKYKRLSSGLELLGEVLKHRQVRAAETNTILEVGFDAKNVARLEAQLDYNPVLNRVGAFSE